ncbi:Tetratricopeptide repeat protein 37 [Camponotus japonicus]
MSDDIKVLLKEARESFKQNEYLETMKKCKKILKKDKNNYMALILLARAMQEIEEFKLQVVLVLQKAVEVQPNNPLAWQGLVAYYEKVPQDNDNWRKLASAYCKLLQLDSDSSKFTYFINKVAEIVLRVKDDDILFEVLDTLSVLRKISNKEKTSLIDKTLAWVLTEYPNSSITKYQEFYEDILASVIKDTDLLNRQEYYRKYLKMLYNSNKFAILLMAAQDMHAQFPQDTCPLEWICCIYYQEAILNEKDLDINITQIYESLLKLNANSETALIAKAIYLKSTDKLINSRECLNQIISLNSQLFYAWLVLSQVYYKLYCWEQTENASKQALQLMKPHLKDKLYDKVKLRLLEAMSRSNNKQKLIQTQQMCEELLKTESSVQLQLIYARTNASLDKPDAIAVLSNLESQDEVKIQVLILKALYLKKHKQYEEAINILELALNNSEAWLTFGKIYWDMGDYNHSLMAFLNGVQADRNNWECMVYLGHYYHEHGNDVERSRRCYHTALQINPNSEEAGIGLSTAYRLLKNTDANIHLLQRVTMQQGIGAKWAWLQLGLQHLDQGDATEAIKALQHVIRADPNDNHSWESLADAYLVRGAHTSALKSYQRALQLSPGALYPMIQLANIKLLIGQHKEAKEDFENILENDKKYILALKGLAQACLGLAKENIAKHFLCRARENLQQAVDNLTEAIMIRSDLSCNWKLLGDVCFRTAGLPEKYCYLRVKSILMKCDSAEEYMKIRGNEILTLSIRCFCRALSTAENSALLWHDLACCYLMQLDRDYTVDKDDTAAKCLAAAKHAIRLCPQSWLHWNILGVICMSPYIKNYALAQHCFVMAIDQESNNAIAWSNLATLYLHLGETRRANKAYSRAQRADPGYMNSWIGQGIIAENSEKVDPQETMDLFRHSTQLGYHNEAALGYAHWVLTTLLDPIMKRDPLFVYVIENMHAIPAAADVLTWYTEYVPNDVYALNTHGLLLERLRLYNTAVKQFVKALKLSQDEEKDMISINLARVLIQIGKHEEAIELCRQVKRGSFNSQCHLALSLFKAKQYEESYNTYEAALHWLADTETHKANILCAMAAIAYIFQGADAVKTLLFQCIDIKPPTIAGFLAIVALGILHDDSNMTSLVLEELKPYTDDHEYGHHVVTLFAYYQIIQGNLTEAIRIFSKAIFRHPNDIRYWVRLVRVSLLNTDLDIFRKCAQTALVLSRNTSMTDIVYVACASAYSHFGTTKGLRQAQKNIFTYPANVESWANFIATLLPRCTDKDSKNNNQWISSLISVIKSQFQTSDYMSQWLHNIQKLSS